VSAGAAGDPSVSMGNDTHYPMSAVNQVQDAMANLDNTAVNTAAQVEASISVPSIESEYGAGSVVMGDYPMFAEIDMPGSGA
jgi:hypothetical protein